MTWVRLHGPSACGSCRRTLEKDDIVRRVAATNGVRCQPCAYRMFPYEPQPPEWYVDLVLEPQTERPWLKWAAPPDHDWHERQAS